MKAVRNKIHKMNTSGRVFKQVDEETFEVLLRAKLLEELGELSESDFMYPAEYADVFEVLDELRELNGVSIMGVAIERQKKLVTLGGFTRCWVIMREIEAMEDPIATKGGG